MAVRKTFSDNDQKAFDKVPVGGAVEWRHSDKRWLPGIKLEPIGLDGQGRQRFFVENVAPAADAPIGHQHAAYPGTVRIPAEGKTVDAGNGRKWTVMGSTWVLAE